MILKTCTRCGTEYPVTLQYFYGHKSCKNGLHSSCKKCCSERMKKHYQRNSEHIKAQVGKHRKQYAATIRGMLIKTFHRMKRRCTDPTDASWKRYGGRSIMCLFNSGGELIDYVTNELQVDPRGLEVHRIDNDGNYENGNIEFLTSKEHGLKHRKEL